MALGRPQRSASDDLKCPQMTSILLGARDEKFGQNPWPLRSLYGLGGHYMALEVIIWPWDDLRGWPQVASDDLNCPQMTSILLSARDKKFGRNTLYGL